MDFDIDAVKVARNEGMRRYEASVNGLTAVVDYVEQGDRLILTHAGVPRPLEGRGLAGVLTRAALDDARARGLTVVPRCSYVASYIRRHPHYLDLVGPDDRERLSRP